MIRRRKTPRVRSIPREPIKWNRKEQDTEFHRPAQHDYIADLRICICCGRVGPVHVAHVRMSRAEYGKFNAMSKKPDSRWLLPLCYRCHLVDQHNKFSEPEFWARLGIDPPVYCLALFGSYPDHDRGMAIVAAALQAIDRHQKERPPMEPGGQGR